RRDPVVGECRIAERAARSCEMLAVSGRIPGAPAHIATAPGVDRRGGRRRYIRRHPLFGSECRRRSQAQRDERYASEKYPFHLNPPFQDLMSISLPGLARFACDVSATLEGIPN